AMLDRNRTVLAVEELQPSWLVSAGSRAVYVLLSRLFAGLAIGTAAACFLGLLAGSPALARAVVEDGVCGGLAVALLDGALLGRRRPRGPPGERRLESGAAYPAPGGAPVGAAVAAAHLAGVGAGGGILFAAMLFHGLLFALILAKPLAAVGFDRDVGAVEALTWSWRGALRGWLGVGALTWCFLALGHLAGSW